MKNWIVMFLVFVCLITVARAEDTGKVQEPTPIVFKAPRTWYFEVEAGRSTFQKIGDGVWYQDDAPHDLQLSGNAYGFTFGKPVSSWFDIRFGYFNLGKVTTNAQATQFDYQYSLALHQCIDLCDRRAGFIGDGSTDGFSLTGQATYRNGRFSLFGEAGITRVHVKWNMKVYSDEATGKWEWWDCQHCKVNNWGMGHKFAIGAGYERVSLAFNHYTRLDVKGDDINNGMPVFKSANEISVRFAF